MKNLYKIICILSILLMCTACSKGISSPTAEVTAEITSTVSTDVTTAQTTKKDTTSKNVEKKTEETTKKLTIDDVNDKMLKKFFKDSLFIGDSRTEGLLLYTDLSIYSTFYSKVGLNITSANNNPFVKLGNKQVTILQALKKKKFKKIYIMLGFNELNWPYEKVFFERYEAFIREIEKLQPKATIYLQSVLHVTKEHSMNDPAEKNSRINKFNKKIKAMQNGKNIKYININPCFDDKERALNAESTTDGIHLKAPYYDTWMKYLVLHP